MACPDLDDFTRADGPIGANWDLPTGVARYDVVSNQLVFDGGGISWAVWNPTGPFTDCCASIKYVDVAGATEPYIWTGARLDFDFTQNSSFTAGYTVEWHATSFIISKWDLSGGFPIEYELTGSAVPFGRSHGDVLGILVEGVGAATNISATVNFGVIHTVNDQDGDGPLGASTNSGWPGIQVNSFYDVTLDDFRGGEDVVPPPPPALDGVDLARVMYRASTPLSLLPGDSDGVDLSAVVFRAS